MRLPLAPAALAAALLIGAGACSLGNLQRADCSNDAQCASLFGVGSRCEQGYCSAVTNANCTAPGEDGRPCFHCAPKAAAEFANACTSATCAAFDEKRLTKLTADGGLPPLP